MIKLSHVSRLYPAQAETSGGVIRALDDVSLEVAPGEWLAVMGPSGSGKSTLVNLIGCLDRPTSGEIWLDGEDVARISTQDLNRARAEKVGFIFQQFHLIPYLTALENVMLAQYFHSMTDEQEALAALERMYYTEEGTQFLKVSNPVYLDALGKLRGAIPTRLTSRLEAVATLYRGSA